MLLLALINKIMNEEKSINYLIKQNAITKEKCWKCKQHENKQQKRIIYMLQILCRNKNTKNIKKLFLQHVK